MPSNASLTVVLAGGSRSRRIHVHLSADGPQLRDRLDHAAEVGRRRFAPIPAPRRTNCSAKRRRSAASKSTPAPATTPSIVGRRGAGPVDRSRRPGRRFPRPAAAGNDKLVGGPRRRSAARDAQVTTGSFGGSGDDMLFGGPGDDLLQGGAGRNTVTRRPRHQRRSRASGPPLLEPPSLRLESAAGSPARANRRPPTNSDHDQQPDQRERRVEPEGRRTPSTNGGIAAEKTVVVRPSPIEPPAIWNM